MQDVWQNKLQKLLQEMQPEGKPLWVLQDVGSNNEKRLQMCSARSPGTGEDLPASDNLHNF